ncbi:MAG: hypothetical protein NVSMB27_10000 [Ktedonobacteraceae bacterium]
MNNTSISFAIFVTSTMRMVKRLSNSLAYSSAFSIARFLCIRNPFMRCPAFNQVQGMSSQLARLLPMQDPGSVALA